MIAHLKGKLVEKNPTHVVIECNGVGYFVNISLHTYSFITSSESIFLYTHLQIREDAQILYGFFEKTEREVFRHLISVSGIGTSTARTMLSSLKPDEVVEAISTSDVATIQSVKGIGAKTAQRVIIDLKDKLSAILSSSEISVPQSNTNKSEALSALETLGYLRKQSEKVVQKIIAENPEVTVESIIKLALKNL